MTQICSFRLQQALKDLQEHKDSAWLVHFVEGWSHDLELRKLPVILGSMNVSSSSRAVLLKRDDNFHGKRSTGIQNFSL